MRNFQITVDNGVQEWGTDSAPKLYGETSLPAKFWRWFEGGTLLSGLAIKTLLVGIGGMGARAAVGNLVVTVFHEGGGRRSQQWGTKADPTAYGETCIPAKFWNQFALGKLMGDRGRFDMATLIVEGMVEEGTRAAAG